jgi:hypothetical protein
MEEIYRKYDENDHYHRKSEGSRAGGDAPGTFNGTGGGTGNKWIRSISIKKSEDSV